jgi:hypothetical protein
MGFRLAPPDGQPFLRPGEIARRFFEAFERVSVDRVGGERFIDELRRANFGENEPPPRGWLEDLRLATLYIQIGFEEREIKVMAVPGHALCFEFSSPAEDEYFRPLVDYVAERLGYVVAPYDWKPAGAGLEGGQA